MGDLYKVFMKKVGSKERTAKVYAATVRRIHRELYKKELADETMAFAKRAKTLNYVKTSRDGRTRRQRCLWDSRRWEHPINPSRSTEQL